MLKQLNQSLFKDVVFVCWMLLSFFGAMRPQDYKLSRLTWRDITLSEDGVDVVLRPTKGIKGHGPFTFSVPRVSGNWLNLPSWLELLQSFLFFRNPTSPIFGRRKLQEKPFSSGWFVSKLQNKLTISAGLPEECPKAPENARKCPETVNIHGRIIIKSMFNVVGNGCAP